jgi:hypothetical protein
MFRSIKEGSNNLNKCKTDFIIHVKKATLVIDMSYRVLLDLFYLKIPVRFIIIFLIYVITCNCNHIPSLSSAFSYHYIKSIKKAEFLKALIHSVRVSTYHFCVIRILYKMKTIIGSDIISELTKGQCPALLLNIRPLPWLQVKTRKNPYLCCDLYSPQRGFTTFDRVIKLSKGVANG